MPVNVFQVILSWKTPQTFGDASLVGYKVLKDGQQYGHLLKREAVHVTVTDLETGNLFVPTQKILKVLALHTNRIFEK